MIHIPAKEERTMEWCKKAVKFSGGLLHLVPKEMRDEEVCEIAVKSDGDALKYVPVELRTERICILACCGRDNWGLYRLHFVPEHLKKMIRLMVEVGMRAL
jgi:hypothetical protein